MECYDFIKLAFVKGEPGRHSRLGIGLGLHSGGDLKSCEIEPHVGLCAQYGVCLDFSLPLLLPSLSKIIESLKKKSV